MISFELKEKIDVLFEEFKKEGRTQGDFHTSVLSLARGDSRYDKQCFRDYLSGLLKGYLWTNTTLVHVFEGEYYLMPNTKEDFSQYNVPENIRQDLGTQAYLWCIDNDSSVLCHTYHLFKLGEVRPI